MGFFFQYQRNEAVHKANKGIGALLPNCNSVLLYLNRTACDLKVRFYLCKLDVKSSRSFSNNLNKLHDSFLLGHPYKHTEGKDFEKWRKVIVAKLKSSLVRNHGKAMILNKLKNKLPMLLKMMDTEDTFFTRVPSR